MILTFERQIKELDKSIERILKAVPQTIQTVPGIGPVFTAGIIADIVQIELFFSEGKIAKYAGLYGRNNQLGRFTAEIFRYHEMGISISDITSLKPPTR